MGELHVDLFTTLDGVVQAPGGPEEDPEGEFEFGGWQAPLLDEEVGRLVGEGIDRLDALLLGRRTYDIFAGYWPNATVDEPIATKFNAIPKYVASRTNPTLEWAGSELLGPDLAAEVHRITALHDEVHVIGSANLVQSLLREDLVDRLNLWVYPITLGTGKKLFDGGAIPAVFRLDGPAITGSSGAVALRYARAEGRPRPSTGDMGAPDRGI
ncbi:dihydrofolate reductase family protein [Agromyces sp. MMS24-K17]|uniref:dihydrofolate reductase family protein n=1 Tax=Agromyces sp. MMS24-K17 TaxID=3372850 RepID=UPI003754050C